MSVYWSDIDKGNPKCRSQWSRGPRRRSKAARLLRLWVRIPPWAWMSVCCECCVLSGRGLCDDLITRPEESSRLCCVVVCDLETSRMRRSWPVLGRSATGKKKGNPKYLKETGFNAKFSIKNPPTWTGLTSNRINHGMSLHCIDNHTQRTSVFSYVVLLSLRVFVIYVSK